MTGDIEFCLLGPLVVRRCGAVVPVSAGRQRALLAALLLRAGQPVGVDELAEVLWGSGPPPSARASLQNYVARLRKTLAAEDMSRIVTESAGYWIRVGAGELDTDRFESSLAAGREAARAGSWADAAAILRAGLSLWRGDPLAGVVSDALAVREVPRLAEMRLQAVEARIDADLHLARHAEVIGELRQLVAREPLRERLHVLLMTALYRDGQQAGALAAYQAARSVLIGELGTEPGPDLRRLQQHILAHEPPPEVTACGDRGQLVRVPDRLPVPMVTGGQTPASKDSGRPEAVAPWPAGRRELPPQLVHFAGRADELAMLTGLLGRDGGERPGTVVISAIDGMPGVGKTALAVQVGHMVASRFPDRQLFVDLHGHTPGQQAADPADVLAALLAADGVDARYLPPDLDGRTAMWRDRMAGQRVLLILDNAASSRQVAPLLPGTPGCLVLVTSRRFLGDLPAAEVPLDVLPPADALAMFTGLAPRSASDPAAVTELVALCGRLPLAISLLARLFTRHRSWSVADLIAETRTRLLTVSAENRTVTAAFEASYQDLAAGRKRFFRYLGLHPGPEIDAFAAAALAGLPLDDAAGHLDALHGGRLLEEPVPCRYRMHDLIRQYARSLAVAEPAAQREQATERLLDYYQHTAEAADVYLARYARPAAAMSVQAPAAAPAVRGRDQALAWMIAERANLLACIDDAAVRHDHGRVARLTAAVAAHLRSDGPWPLAIVLHTAAVRAAQHLGDWRAEASALEDLGDMWRVTGNYRDAADVLEQALGICGRNGDRLGEANALLNLGIVQQLTDDRPGAAAALERALDIYRDIGDRVGEASALLSLGDVRRVANDYGSAADALEQALDIYRDIGDQPGEANALFHLGAVRHMAGDFAGAIYLLKLALNLSRGISSRLVEANALCWLGDAQRATGDFRAAAELLEQSLDIYRRVGSRLGEANALCWLGGVRQVTGDFSGAAEVLQQALDIYRDIGDRLGHANVLCGLAEALHAGGDLTGAAEVLEQSLVIYRETGDRLGEAEALNQAGAVHLSRGDRPRARACYRRALELARVIGSELEEARALEGTGRCAARLLATEGARGALQQALDIYQRLGTADAARLDAEMNCSHSPSFSAGGAATRG